MGGGCRIEVRARRQAGRELRSYVGGKKGRKSAILGMTLRDTSVSAYIITTWRGASTAKTVLDSCHCGLGHSHAPALWLYPLHLSYLTTYDTGDGSLLCGQMCHNDNNFR
jgi:hypothetical protein